MTSALQVSLYQSGGDQKGGVIFLPSLSRARSSQLFLSSAISRLSVCLWLARNFLYKLCGEGAKRVVARAHHDDAIAGPGCGEERAPAFRPIGNRTCSKSARGDAIGDV